MLDKVPLDDQVDAQPLIVTNQPIQGMRFGAVVYVATENNTVYAIEASTGNVLLTAKLGTPVPMSGLPGQCGNNADHIGITSTQVIDTASGVMYVVTYSLEGDAPIYRIHELSLDNLTDKVAPVAVSASQKIAGGTTSSFRPAASRQRSALLEANGNIYAGFASFCDQSANTSRGWLLGWKAETLQPLGGGALLDSQTDAQTPSGQFKDYFLSSIWMSGYGVAADTTGDLYFVTGNSDTVRNNNIQESAVRMSPDLVTIKDFFTPANMADLDQHDHDFGSGGLMVLPQQRGQPPNLAAAAGKDGRLFIINRDDMGRFVSGGPDKPINVPIGGCWCGPSYFVGADGVERLVSSGGAQVNTWTIQSSAAGTTVMLDGTSANLFTSNLFTGGLQDPGFLTTVSSNGTEVNSAVLWGVSRPDDSNSNTVSLYAFSAVANGTMMYFRGTDNKVWRVSADGTSVRDNVGGFTTLSDVFLADDGLLYFRGTDDTVWRVSTDGAVVRENPGGFKTQSNVFVVGGFMYFRGTDNKVWRVSADGQTVRDNVGGFTTQSDVVLGADGLLYFQGTDNKVWRVSTDGTSVRENVGGFTTLSDVLSGADGMIYFRGTDNKVWRVSTDGTTVRSNPGGFTTLSNVRLGADGMMYFRGTDNKIWRVSTDGTTVRDNVGGFTTQSDVVLGADGLLYFQGTDNKVWRVSTDGTTVRSNPGGFTTQSDVLPVALGFLPELWHGVAGTWPNVGGNADLVPTVDGGQVSVASYKQLAIFGLVPAGNRVQMLQTVDLPQAPPTAPGSAISGSHFFGTITSVNADQVLILLRTGKTLTINLADARQAFRTVIPFVGENVFVNGSLEANGALNAQTMLRAKGPASWGPDSQ